MAALPVHTVNQLHTLAAVLHALGFADGLPYRIIPPLLLVSQAVNDRTLNRTAAAAAIEAAETVVRTVDIDITVNFEYPYMNGIMKVIKETNPIIVSKKFDMDCQMTLRIRKSEAEKLKGLLLKVESAYIPDS